MLRFLTGDLGNGQLRAIGASMRAAPAPLLAFIAMGTVVTSVGAWLPARAAARQAPAPALKGGDGDYAVAARSSAYLGVALLGGGAVLVAAACRGRPAAVWVCRDRLAVVRVRCCWCRR